MKIPPHKVVGDVGKPGQIVNRPAPTASFDRYPYLKHSTADSGDHTLADYLTRKKRYEALDTLQPLTEAPKKLTFGQWADTATDFDIEQVDFVYHGLVWEMLEKCWKAAQENAPSYRPGAEEKT